MASLGETRGKRRVVRNSEQGIGERLGIPLRHQ